MSSYIRPEKIPVFITPLCKTSILTNTLKAEWPNKYTSKKYIKIFILNESTIWIHMSLYTCYHWILLKPSMICSRVYQNSIIKVDLIKDEKYLEFGKSGIPLDLGLIHYSSVSTILG